MSRPGENEPSWLAREPFGIFPFRYRSESIPWASGEKPMQPIPSSPSASSTPSVSIQRFSIEYDGWWMRIGVPRPRMIAAASCVFCAE